MSTKVKKFPIKTVLSIVLNVFFYLVIIFLLLFAIANMKIKTQADIPHIFGRGFLSVQSGSMAGSNKDSFNEGDLIFVKVIKTDSASDYDYKVGQVVTWYNVGKKEFWTHRIVEVGSNFLIVQGDFVAEMPGRAYDPERSDNNPNDYEIISKSEVKAIHISTWGGAGGVLDFLMSPVGFPLCIVLPAVLILIFEGFILIRNIIRYNNAKMEAKFKGGKPEDLADLELEREKIRQELLEEMKKEQEEKD